MFCTARHTFLRRKILLLFSGNWSTSCKWQPSIKKLPFVMREDFSPRGKLFNTVHLNLCLSLRWSYQFYHFPLVCPDIIIAWDSGTHSNSHCFRHHYPKLQSKANDWQSSSCVSHGGTFQGWKAKSQLTPSDSKSSYQELRMWHIHKKFAYSFCRYVVREGGKTRSPASRNKVQTLDSITGQT